MGLPWVMWETQPMLTWVMLLIGDEQLPSYMGVSKKWVGPPKMDGLYIVENVIQMDDLGGKPTIFGNTHMKGLYHKSL